MEANDLAKFNDGVSLAQAGKKEEAYRRFKALAINNVKDANLFLWLAFTTPNALEAQRAIREAISIEPSNPNLKAAKEWFDREKRKELPAQGFTSSTQEPVIEVASSPSNQNYSQHQQQQHNGFSQPPATFNHYNAKPNQGYIGGFPPTNFVYNYQNYYGAHPFARNNWFYAIPCLGALILFGSTFLPWLQMGYLNLEVSMNGLGMLSGSSVLVGGIQRSGNTPGLKDGVFFLGLGVLISLVGLAGFVRKKITIDWAVIVLGLISIGLSIFEIVDTTKRVAELNMTLTSDIGGQSGFGLTVALFGSVITIFGGFIVSAGPVFFRPKY
jgi:hypothetical protein